MAEISGTQRSFIPEGWMREDDGTCWMLLGQSEHCIDIPCGDRLALRYVSEGCISVSLTALRDASYTIVLVISKRSLKLIYPIC